MSTKSFTLAFESPENFNENTEDILPDTWSEVQKALSFFSNYVKSNGPDSFLPTNVVFNNKKNIVGVFTVRPFDGKEDLYQALSEILYFPIAINSGLYIVVTDTNVRDPDTGEKTNDAVNMAFVSPDFCYIYTLPYTVDSDNIVTYLYDKSFLVSVDKDTDDDPNASGDMIELFFIFSHVENTGPFTVDELLSYYDENQVTYEIINMENLNASRNKTIFKD